MELGIQEDKLKVYTVGGGYSTGWINTPFTRVTNVEDADIAIFPGGADISPTLYGDNRHPSTYDWPDRDKLEVGEFNKMPFKILKIGICRGAQLLTALSGGKLIQDVYNHVGSHFITTQEAKVLKTTSIHHQMMYPYLMKKEEYNLIAWSTTKRSETYGVGGTFTVEEPFLEPEIVYYPGTNSLCIQGHPESMDPNCDLNIYFNNLVEKILREQHEQN